MIRNERNRSLEYSKRRVQEKENEEKEEMTCEKDVTECEYCSNTATVTHKNTIGEIVKLCKSCKETQTKV
jgi:hypothetical protein